MPGRPGTPMALAPLSPDARLDLANRLFREYLTRCFWHCPRDLVIGEELVPMVVSGLRKHGGRRGFILAGQLEACGTFRGTPESSDRESP